MTLPFPPEPVVPSEQRASGDVDVRYEDICQDGRLTLLGMPHAYGGILFRDVLDAHPVTTRARETGILPILSRLLLEGTSEVVSVNRRLSVRGAYELTRTRGETPRLFLNLWAEIHGPRELTMGLPLDAQGELRMAGRVFAEHTFTRPFGPPAERRVSSLDPLGLPMPETIYAPGEPAALLSLPPGAAWLDEHEVLDPAPIAFSLSHTDSNQHVNSLVYPALFDEAACRRFVAHGRSAAVLARRLEIAYRKPCFAGDRARVALRAFTLGGQLGAVGRFVAEADVGDVADLRAARPHCYVTALFSP